MEHQIQKVKDIDHILIIIMKDKTVCQQHQALYFELTEILVLVLDLVLDLVLELVLVWTVCGYLATF